MPSHLSRRRFLALGGAALLAAPGLALVAAPGEQRFVFVMLRGAMDGLQAVMPVGDPAYRAARGALADPRPEDGEGLKLDSLFMLHPALRQAGTLYASGELAIVHAIASPYRERSHFDGQKVLESGGATPLALDNGWMNRLLPLLGGGQGAIAIAPVVPLALRGAAPVSSYAPSALPDADADLLQRVATLYQDDGLLQPLWERAMAARALAGDAPERRGNPAALARMAAQFLSEPAGARVAMLELDGFDTHAQQAARLPNQLARLDAVLGALKEGLGPHWSQTLVLVATEFGRTVAVNGTGGTDHGTGGAALLAGGSVRGGRVIADWPGLKQTALLEGRDLLPTADLRALILGLTAAHFRLDSGGAGRALFPGAGITPMPGLLRS